MARVRRSAAGWEAAAGALSVSQRHRAEQDRRLAGRAGQGRGLRAPCAAARLALVFCCVHSTQRPGARLHVQPPDPDPSPSWLHLGVFSP